jgi:phosphatidylserine/phosphatidylglycerophosphate/cardiolipin synthase-like enzyme
MMESLLRLTDADLLELVKALKSYRLAAPYTAMAVQRVASNALASQIAIDLQHLADQDFTPLQLAMTIDLMVKARSQRGIPEDIIDLVITGPEAPGICNRDTSVVVRELFANACQSVLVAGYAVYQGQRVFEALADRMQELPELMVRMFLDIQRGPAETSASTEIVRRFAERFRTTQWPKGRRFPEVFFDPRSLETDSQKRACLHAKCIVVDRKAVFVSSANFTEAAQQRNLEVGLLIHCPRLADRVQEHFNSLVAERLLLPVF